MYYYAFIFLDEKNASAFTHIPVCLSVSYLLYIYVRYHKHSKKFVIPKAVCP